MNAIPFDTMKMARRLENAGFTGSQAAGTAEAMAEAMSGSELATKDDLLEVKSDLLTVTTGLERDIARVRTDLEHSISQVRIDLEYKIALMGRDLTIRLGGMIIAATGILLAAMRFMPLHP